MLPLVMVLLVVVATLSTSMVNTGILSERVAGNYSDRDRAFYAADATMTLVEGWIKSSLPPFEPFQVQMFSSGGRAGPFSGFYNREISIDDAIADNVVGKVNRPVRPAGVPRPVFEPVTIPDVNRQPVFIVELLTIPCTGNGITRITIRLTTRGWGSKPTTAVTLQSLYSFTTTCNSLNGIGDDLSSAI